MAFVMPTCQTHTLGWAVEFAHMSFLHRKSLTRSALSCWHCPPPSLLCGLPPPQRGGGMWSKAPLFQLDRGQASCSAAGANEQPLYVHTCKWCCAVVAAVGYRKTLLCMCTLCANGCQSVLLCEILTYRCQGWSSSGVSQLKYGAHSTSSLDHLWLQHCPCGSSWVLREPLWRDAH